MSRVLLDTVGLIALCDTHDQWHDAASAAFARLQAGQEELCATTFILAECGNAVARSRFHQSIVDLRARLESEDARRGTFYCTAVERGICIDGPLLIGEMELRERIDGLGWPVFATERLPIFPTAQIALPSAAILARLSGQSRSVVQTGDLEPLYLRDPHITQPKVRPESPIIVVE